MQEFILRDLTYVQRDIVDNYISLIWTERYSASGDFTLIAENTAKTRSILTEGLMCSIPSSNEIMLIDSYLEENGTITVTGKSLIDHLTKRMFRADWHPATTQTTYGGRPTTIMYQIFTDGVLPNGLIAGDFVLPVGLGVGEVIDSALGVDEKIGDTNTSLLVPFGTLYDALKFVADKYNLGFNYSLRYAEGGADSIQFNVYSGKDRTSTQSDYPAVIFDPALDSLSDVKVLRSMDGYITHVYLFCQDPPYQSVTGSAKVAGGDSITKFARRTLVVMDDITWAAAQAAGLLPAQFTKVLNDRAANVLANNNYVRMVDGQVVPQNSGFVYGVDYSLGDIIELRNVYGTPQRARVTEYIRSTDSTGDRGYPTISIV